MILSNIWPRYNKLNQLCNRESNKEALKQKKALKLQESIKAIKKVLKEV